MPQTSKARSALAVAVVVVPRVGLALRRDNAVQIVISVALRASAHNIVGNRCHVAIVARAVATHMLTNQITFIIIRTAEFERHKLCATPLERKEAPGRIELHARQPRQTPPGCFSGAVAVVKFQVLLFAGCFPPHHGPYAVNHASQTSENDVCATRQPAS